MRQTARTNTVLPVSPNIYATETPMMTHRGMLTGDIVVRMDGEE